MLKVLFFVAVIQTAHEVALTSYVTSRPVTDQGLEELEFLKQCDSCRYSDIDASYTALKDKRLRSCFVTGLDPEWLLDESDKLSIILNEPCERVGSERDYVLLRKRTGTTIAEMCRDLFIFWVNVNINPPPFAGITTSRPEVCRFNGAPPHIGDTNHGRPVIPSKGKGDGAHAVVNITFDDNFWLPLPQNPRNSTDKESDLKLKTDVSSTETKIYGPIGRNTDNPAGTENQQPTTPMMSTHLMLAHKVTHRNLFLVRTDPPVIPVTDKDGDLIPPLIKTAVNTDAQTQTLGQETAMSTPHAPPPLRQHTNDPQTNALSAGKQPPESLTTIKHEPSAQLEGRNTSWPSYAEILGHPHPSRDPGIGPGYRNADGKTDTNGDDKSPASKDRSNASGNKGNDTVPQPFPYPIPTMGSLDTPSFPIETLLQRLLMYGSPFARPKVNETQNNSNQPNDNALQNKDTQPNDSTETTTATIAPPPPDMRAPALPLFDTLIQNKVNPEGRKPETTTATIAPPPPDMRAPALPLFDTSNQNKMNPEGKKPETTTATIAPPPPNMRAPHIPAGVWSLMNNKA